MEKKPRVSHRGDAVVVNRKLRLLYLVDYMRENSDENHPVRLKAIAEYLTNKGIYTTRKALYDDFAVLEEYGIEIQRVEGTYTYFYASPVFELSELKLLMDIIYASGFISQKKTDALIQRLMQFCSRYQRAAFSRQMLTVGAKSKNEEILYNVDHICEAITRNCQISFRYVDYVTAEGEKHYRKKGECYTRSPIHLVYSDNQYYLLCYNTEKRRREPFRVDRMEAVQVLDGQPRRGLAYVSREIAHDYIKQVFSMFDDEKRRENVTIRFTNNLRGAVYDRFGNDIMLSPHGDRHFEITQRVAVSRQFFGWIVGFGKQAVIIRPKSVREELRNYLTEIGAMYGEYRP